MEWTVGLFTWTILQFTAPSTTVHPSETSSLTAISSFIHSCNEPGNYSTMICSWWEHSWPERGRKELRWVRVVVKGGYNLSCYISSEGIKLNLDERITKRISERYGCAKSCWRGGIKLGTDGTKILTVFAYVTFAPFLPKSDTSPANTSDQIWISHKNMSLHFAREIQALNLWSA